MSHLTITEPSTAAIKKSLKRLETLIKSPHVRPADYATRDRLARRLREARDPS